MNVPADDSQRAYYVRAACGRRIGMCGYSTVPESGCTCSPRESEGICFTGVGLCVCLSVTTITKKIVDGFVPNFMGRFLGGKGRPSSRFVTIGRGMWK